MKQVAIILFNWNGWRDTLAGLALLQKLDSPSHRVLVVDNASTNYSVARVTVDTLILFGMAQRFLSSSVSIIQFVAFTIGSILLLLTSAVLPMGVALKGPFLFLTLLAFVLITWLLILAPEERSFAHNYLKIAQVILTGRSKP